MKIQRVHYEHETTASAEAIWEVLTDAATWSAWGPWAESSQERAAEGPDGPAGVGSIRRLKFGRRLLREETTRFEPRREVRYTVLEGIPVRDYEGIVHLEPNPTGTRITWSSSFHGRPGVLGPLIRKSLQSKFGPIVTACAEAAEARERAATR